MSHLLSPNSSHFQQAVAPEPSADVLRPPSVIVGDRRPSMKEIQVRLCTCSVYPHLVIMFIPFKAAIEDLTSRNHAVSALNAELERTLSAVKVPYLLYR